jgi:hypothetical protein
VEPDLRGQPLYQQQLVKSRLALRPLQRGVRPAQEGQSSEFRFGETSIATIDFTQLARRIAQPAAAVERLEIAYPHFEAARLDPDKGGNFYNRSSYPLIAELVDVKGREIVENRPPMAVGVSHDHLCEPNASSSPATTAR